MRRKPPVTARSIVAWSAVAFVAVQVALNVTIELQHPEIYDPEYRDRLSVLRQRVAEHPERLLLVVVGSSRIITDFRPEVLPRLCTPAGQYVLPFNLSHSGAGPLLNLVAVERLLRDGLRPRWLVVEIVPPLLGASGQSTAAALAEAGDLPLLSRYLNQWKLAGRYAWERAAAGFSHRDACLRFLARWCLARPAEWDAIPLDDLGGTTSWLDFQTGPQDAGRRTAVVHDEYYAGLQHFHIGDAPDRATRELLALCRRLDIPVTLLLTPESSTFRGWYARNANSLLQQYCDQLSRDYRVAVVDARDWLADKAFIDGHHIFPEDAKQFTLRLGREVLQPMVEGRIESNTAEPPVAKGNRASEPVNEESEPAEKQPPARP